MLAALGRSVGQVARARTAFAPARMYAVNKEILDDIDKIVKGNDVVVFMKGSPDQPMCGFSRAVVQLLDTQGLTQYEHVNVLADSNMREGIKEYSSWPTIPQLFVKGEFIGGADIALEMFKNGELESLFVKNKLL